MPLHLNKKTQTLIAIVALVGLGFLAFYLYQTYQTYQNTQNTKQYIQWNNSVSAAQDVESKILLSEQFRNLISAPTKYSIDLYIADQHAQQGRYTATLEILESLAKKDLPEKTHSILLIKHIYYLIESGATEDARNKLENTSSAEIEKLDVMYDWLYTLLFEKTGDTAKAQKYRDALVEKIEKNTALSANTKEPFIYITKLKNNAFQNQ